MILENSPTPDISGSHTWLIQDGQQITNFLGGQPDDINYFITTSPGVKIKSNEFIKLEAGVEYSPAIGDTLMIIYDGDCWYELSRSLNPLYSGLSLDEFQMDGAFIERQIELIKQQIASNMEYCLTNINDLQNQISEFNYGGSVNSEQHFYFSESTFNEFQTTIDSLGKYLSADVYLEFIPGSYNIINRIKIDDFYGPGIMHMVGPSSQRVYTPTKNTIFTSTGILTSTFDFENCNCGIILNGMQFNHNNQAIDNHSGALNFISCGNVELKNLSVNNTNYISHNIHGYKSELSILNTYFQKGLSAIFANERSRFVVENCDDFSFTPNIGLYASRASYIGVVDNQYPDGSINDVKQEHGSMIVV